MFQEGKQVTRGRIDATNGSRTCHSNPFAPCPSLQGRFVVAHSASVTHEVLRKKASSHQHTVYGTQQHSGNICPPAFCLNPRYK